MVTWDGVSLGSWVSELEKADVVINLAGRGVNCRYNHANRREIMESRTKSTRILGEALTKVAHPPSLWMNASTATIYRHALDRPMEEDTGEPGGNEPNAPSSWRFSIDVAKRWEESFFAPSTPKTRKIALQTAMTMSPDRGGIFDVLLRLARFGLGGASGSGRQFVSWIHQADYVRAIDYLIAKRGDGGLRKHRCARAPAEQRIHGCPAGCLGQAHWTAGGAMDAGNRSHLSADRNRIDPKEPPGCSGPFARGWFSVPIFRLALGRAGSRRTVAERPEK